MAGEELNPQVVLTADVSSYEQNIRTAEQQTNSLLGAVTGLIEGMAKLNQSAGRNIQLVGAGTTAGLVGATAAAARFQQQMQGLEASSVMAGRAVQGSYNQVNQLRGEMAVTTGEVVALTTQLNKLGQGNRPVAEISREFIKLSAVTGESIPSLTQGMVQLQRQMGTEGVQNTKTYTAALANLSEQAGTSASGILEFANVIAPVSQMAGMTQKEIMGFSTAFNRAGVDGFGAASAYQKIVTDITRAVKFGSPELQGYANLLGVSVEQMKNIPVSESIERVFNVISSQGPEAIKTLEQLGLDGMRSYRSIVGVAQGGKIGDSMRLAHEDSTEKFAKAADAALAGVNDQMQIFQNNLARTGQALGATFLPPLELLLKVLTGISGAVAGATEALGKLPGVGLAVGAAGLLAGGTVVRSAGALMLAGTGALMARSSFRAGSLVARGRTSGGNAWAGRQAVDVERGLAGPFQRATYAMGHTWGTSRAESNWGRPGGPGFMRRGFNLANYGAGQAIHGAGYLVRAGLQPLFPDRLHRIANRDQIGGSRTQRLGRMWAEGSEQSRWSRAFMGQSRGEMRGAGAGMGPGLAGVTQRLSALSRGTADLTQEQQRYRTATRALVTETSRYATALGRASMGAAGWAGGAAGRGIGRGVSAIGGHLGRGLGALGAGPMALMAGIGVGMGAYGQQRSSFQNMADSMTSAEDTSGIAQYESALGLASKATTSFADVVNQARDEILNGDNEDTPGLADRPLTAEDARMATRGEFGYTNPAVANLKTGDLAPWASLIVPGASDDVLASIKMDVLKRVGGDVDLANQIMRQAEEVPDIRGRMSNLLGGGFFSRLTGAPDEEQIAQFQGIRSEAGRLVTATPYESREQNSIATLNQALLGLREETGKDTRWIPGAGAIDALSGDASRRRGMLNELSGFLGGTTKEDRNALERAYMDASGPLFNQRDDKEFLESFYNTLRNDKSDMGRRFRELESYVDGDLTSTNMDQIPKEIQERPYARWGSEGMVDNLMDTDLGRRIMPQPHIPQPSILGIPQEAMGSANRSLTTNAFGQGGAQAQKISEALSAALESPENPNMQNRASWEMATGLTELTGGFRQTQQELMQFRDRINDANDPLYQLATSAYMANRKLQEESLRESSTAERFTAYRQQERDARERYNNDPEALGGFEDWQFERDRLMDARESWRQRNIGIVRSGREMDIGFEQQGEDYTRQKAWSDEDFNRQRGWATEDFSRGRQMQDEARERQIGRGWRDFNISRERGQYEFDLSRTRQEESYGRQLGRSWRDFNISRERSQYEFDLSRTRQEESYNRQLSRTWRDFNISRERSEYDFTLGRERQEEAYARQLERTWRDYNISRERQEEDFQLQRVRGEEDFQLQRFRAQRNFDLQRTRSYFDFNLQRQRQEEDFNHQLVLMAEQSARTIYNIYERVAVQRTLSGENVVRNMEDQARRMAEQQENLAKARAAGLSDEAIRMLGLNEAGNAQQLARLMADIMNNPELIAMLNAQTADRLDEAGNLITDPANTQYQEMLRQFQLQRDRAAEDFQRSMERSREDFQRGMAEMREDYLRSLDRAADDFARMRDRASADFMRSINDQRTEFDISLRQGAEDFNRMRTQQYQDFMRSINDQRTEFDISMQQSADDFSRMRNQQYTDFTTSLADQRSEFDISMAQSATDFARMREQQHTDFMKSLADQATDYQIQTAEQQRIFDQNQDRQLESYNNAAARQLVNMGIMQDRTRAAFSRAQEEMNLSMHDAATQALEYLTGSAADQHNAVRSALGLSGQTAIAAAVQMVKDLMKVFDGLGINSVYLKSANHGGADPTKNSALAEGGPVPGVSSHKKADDIPIWATAGEFMQPVDTVEHYGVDVMEKMRKREIPKEMFEGYAEGGQIAGLWGRANKKSTLVSLGRDLQRRGFHVGEHPGFGGVHPTAHLPTSKGGLHYIGHAIDVNHDGRGQAFENKMLDALVSEVTRLGLGFIWRSQNHYGHMHIDTSRYQKMNNVLSTVGDGTNFGPLTGIEKDSKSGLFYLEDVYKQLKSAEGWKKFEHVMAGTNLTKGRYVKRGAQKAAAIRAYDEMMFEPHGPVEGNEDFVATGVERWRPLVLSALGMVNQSRSLADITLRRMNQESSGNPKAINLWDSNAKRGTPSKGLMQVIDPTFNAYAMRGYNRDIWDPMSNVLASMRYALGRYGNLHNAYARPGGYAEGGLVNWHGEGAIFTGPTKIGVGERGPEMVLPLYGRGVEFLNSLLNRGQNNDWRDTFVRRDGVPEVSKQIVYNSHYDQSTHYNGEITVVSQDPDEMGRKLEAKRRQEALIGRHKR